ncbi:hypothetical protein K8I85_03095 [bacterium]|nr:hypothetical protein [bacterium]
MAMIERAGRPSPRDLRWFGPILLFFVGVLGSMAMWRFDAPRVGVALWALGAPFVVLYFALPPTRIPIYRAYMALFFPVGWTISQAVLLVLFFGIVTPTALLMRLFRYDPMKRRADPEAGSYWIDQRTGGETSRYLKQH